MGKKVSDIPHMLKMWDFELNTDEPDKVSVHLEDPRHWKCPDCGYTWTSSVKARCRSSGKCPCHESNKVIMKGVNDVLTIVKGLSDLLDEDNDFELIHTQGIDSSIPVNLYCKECGRKWSVMLKSQIKKDGNDGYIVSGCPHYNTVKRKKNEVPFCNEVESIYRFWDDNNPLNPYRVKSNSNQKAHFICRNCGYDWATTILAQAQGTGKCKCCELQRVTRKGYTDVFTLIPDSRKYFNFGKNKDIDIYSILLRNSDTPIDWKCPDCGYEWSAPLASRIRGKKDSYSFKGCQQCYLHSVERITPVASIPKLVKYWDFKKNKGIDINLTSAHSYDSAFWRDKKCGYEWEETIKGFNGRDDECPFCAGKQNAIMLDKNDIFTICPELASIYDFETNERNGIDICSLTPNSRTEAHFKCKKCGNEWDSPISNRIKLRNGKYVFVDCPECSNKSFRKIPYSEEYPDLAAMYRKDLNNVELDSIRGTNAINYTYYHWNCLICGETFESTLRAMTQSRSIPTKGCPYCSHTKVRKGESFGDMHPELIREYDTSNEIDILKAFPNGKESVRWICKDCGYKWEATFALRHMGSGKCPECYKLGRNIKEECFAAVYPEYVELWSSDNKRTPYDTFYTSNLWIHWNCQNCGSVYGAEIKDMINGDAGCPYCRGIKLNPETNSLRVLYPNIARRWSNNNAIESNMVLPTAGNPYKWICDTCHGEYTSRVKDVVAGADECPYCKGTKVLAGFNSLKAINPELAKQISPLNEVDADHILPSKQSVQLWRCPDCGSDYNATTLDMENGYTCPYCSDRVVLPGINSLKAKNPELAKLISPLNEKDSDHILPSKQSVQLWRCPDCGGDYTATTLDMENGYTCPYCNDRLLLKGFNSFGDKHPDLLEEMDGIANYLLPYTEFDVMDKSTKKFWWTCTKNPRHKYPMSPNTRLMFQKRNREPCLYCRGQRRKLNRFVKYDPDK